MLGSIGAEPAEMMPKRCDASGADAYAGSVEISILT